MNITLLLAALCLAVGLASAVRNHSDNRHALVNRPKIDTFGPREKRSPWPWAGVKGQEPTQTPPSGLELKVRKGEYVCGNKICKLEPGKVPEGCNGVCQYPMGHDTN